MSCTQENSFSEDIDMSQINLDASNHDIHSFCFDSIQIHEDFVVKAYIDTVSKSKYFLVANYQGQNDTLRLSHLNSENTFPRIISNDESWENVYHNPSIMRYYFTLNFFTVEKLGAIEVLNNKPVFLFQEKQLLATNSAFIVSTIGFEVPMVRGKNQGFSQNYNFDFQSIGEIVLTSRKTERLIETIP
jgi:hypothetical protein